MIPTREELVKLVVAAYPDEDVMLALVNEDGTIKRKGHGDGLAEFILEEIIETYDSLDPLAGAIKVLEVATLDIETVVDALVKAQMDGGA